LPEGKVARINIDVRHHGQRDLPFPSTWGGRRRGAGRRRQPGSGIPHRSRGRLASRHPVHVTIRVRQAVPSLRSVRLVREVERSWREACERGRFRLLHYSLQWNHAHLIVEARDAEHLGRGMMSLGSRLARAVNRTFGRRGRVLQDRYHARVLKTPRQVRNALAYVLLNARRHAGRRARRRGTVDPASSGRWFDGWRTHPAPAPDPPAVARPRTWLAGPGWRRHGRIALDEVPVPAEDASRGRPSAPG
jgi:REP element-mobilizing transposase RayT